MRERSAFTLIELLIVVLIIAILAAIAVPNFLEFQTRAKVSRVVSDMRSATIAIEAYYVDNNEYPFLKLYWQAGKGQWDRGGIYNVVDLSTPIAYMSNTNILDPFQPPSEGNSFNDIFPETQGEVSRTINYMNIDLALGANVNAEIKYALVSYGPDTKRGPIPGVGTPFLGTYKNVSHLNNYYKIAQYDPTNGTISGGDILRFQGLSE